MEISDTKAVRDVVRERFRQITELGYSYEHDDRHNTDRELVTAAIYYAADEPIRKLLDSSGFRLSDLHRVVFDPRDDRTNVVRAAALLIAEVERVDRQNSVAAPGDGDP
jgi:hypothetical protein